MADTTYGELVRYLTDVLNLPPKLLRPERLTFQGTVGVTGVVLAPNPRNISPNHYFICTGMRGYARLPRPDTGYSAVNGASDFDPRNICLVTFQIQDTENILWFNNRYNLAALCALNPDGDSFLPGFWLSQPAATVTLDLAVDVANWMIGVGQAAAANMIVGVVLTGFLARKVSS
jgi:hypothetical protein